ncbi:molybdopterin-binding protein [Ornithinibacillus halophilus]|uniref:Peptidyl-prolyl cis-trans isomerase n=1 Tax=Ornithinibacillus halophilus TaxID=930117 RepID=A0A1M5C1H3_9BACI|nr:hypothetical protein [Ornithinibacillus halophilus]SHF48541.1 hypothetical protein SAMN05216225_100114 [Ornithinibacillus halophilus]
MIVPITGKIQYTITMDPTVWIFDDRKIILEEAFTANEQVTEENELEKAAERWDSEISPNIKPPVNKSISRLEGKKILTESYVMPVKDFIGHAEIKPDAEQAMLVTSNGEVILSLEELEQSYLLFSINGKPIKDDGPVHLYFKDGSNKDNPIKAINNIVIT